MKQQQQSITSLPPSPDAERHGRMLKYGIMMGIRVICLIVVFFVPGWWAVIPAIGAVFLPYFAVVVANVGWDRYQDDVQRPGNILPVDGPGSGRPSPTNEPGSSGQQDSEGHA